MSINIKKKALNVKNGDTYDNFDMFFLGDVEEAVDDWFEEHPEAVTNVSDNSITAAKLAPAVREAVDGVDDLEDEVTDLKSALINIGGQYVDSSKMKLGDITAGTSGWTYKDRTYGVITQQGYTIPLKNGDKVWLTDYTYYKVAVSWHTSSDTYGTSGFVTSEKAVVEADGDCVINVQLRDTSGTASISDVLKILKIESDGELRELDKKIDNVNSSIGGVNIPSLILGNVSIAQDGTPTYQVRDYGVITPQNSYCYFPSGTVLSLSSYTSAKFFVSLKLANGKFKDFGWITSGSFEIPESGQYTLNIQSVPTTTQSSIDALFSLFTIQTKTVDERMKILQKTIEEHNPEQYGLNGIKVIETIDNHWPQGVALMGNNVLAFYASNDAHTNHADVKIYSINDLTTQIGKYEHNLGHCGSADYNEDVDILLVANCNYPAPPTPIIYLISSASSLQYNDIIEYDGKNVCALDLSNITSEAISGCFGENEDIIYAIAESDDYDTELTKTIFKLQVGYGTNNMVSLFPTTSIGTYTASDEAVPNGTARVLKTYEVDFPGEVQGLKYINGKLVVPMDSRVPTGTKTAFLVTIGMYKDLAIVDKTLWLPSINKNGTYPALEAEDVFFDGGIGYVDLGSDKILKFNATQL